MLIEEDALSTKTSWVSKPIDETTKVTGSLGTDNSKLPFASVKDPSEEPFTEIETAGTGC